MSNVNIADKQDLSGERGGNFGNTEGVDLCERTQKIRRTNFSQIFLVKILQNIFAFCSKNVLKIKVTELFFDLFWKKSLPTGQAD